MITIRKNKIFFSKTKTNFFKNRIFAAVMMRWNNLIFNIFEIK